MHGEGSLVEFYSKFIADKTIPHMIKLGEIEMKNSWETLLQSITTAARVDN